MKYHICNTVVCQKVSYCNFIICSNVKLRPLPPRIFPVLHLYASLEPYSGDCRYILPFLNIYCVNWNVLHRYHLSHSAVNTHFIMGDNHTIFTIFYYLRSRDVIWHFFRFVRVIFLSTQLREGLSHFVTLGIEFPWYGLHTLSWFCICISSVNEIDNNGIHDMIIWF